MRKQVTNEFKKIRDALNSYETEVELTLTAYRRDVAAAKEEAALYKDPAEQLARVKKQLIPPARSRIAAADATLANAVKDGIAELRSALAQHVTEQPDAALVSVLHDYREFGVKLDRVELEALALQSAGNYTTLRLLTALAAQSGFKLSAPTAADFEQDIKALEAMTVPPLMLCPAEYATEAADVMEDVPYRRADQSIAYQSGRPTATYMTVRASQLKNLKSALDTASSRWGTHFVPVLTELQPIRDTAGRPLMNEEQQRTQAIRKVVDAVSIDVDHAYASEELACTIEVKNEESEQAAAKLREKYLNSNRRG